MTTLDSNVAQLARVPPFSLMPREAVQLIAFSSVKQRVRAGDVLFRAGEEGDAGYFVHSGALLLEETRTPAGRARRVGSGALIGESALYATAVRRVDARIVENAVLTRISRETFRRVLAEFPDTSGTTSTRSPAMVVV